MDRRAKIVCTLGPATSSEEAITSLIEAGMNVARMNFSHGDYADHKVVHGHVRSAAAKLGKTERRLALVILLTALLPLASAMVLAYSMLNVASSLWVRPEIEQELGHAPYLSL